MNSLTTTSTQPAGRIRFPTAAPTDKQLETLGRMCEKAGIEFRQPKDRAQASRAIGAVAKKLDANRAEAPEAPEADAAPAASSPTGPTEGQLGFLRDLCRDTGVRYVEPADKTAAAKRIDQLAGMRRGLERRIPAELRRDEHNALIEDFSTIPGARIVEDDTTTVGYGAEAAWA